MHLGPRWIPRRLAGWIAGWLAGALFFCASARAEEYVNTRVGVLQEFPREIARGEKLVIAGGLKGKYRTPELVVIAPNGRTYLNRKGRVTPTTFAFEAELSEGVGIYRMEILCHSFQSTQSVARFNIWHGKRKPKKWEEPPLPTGPLTPPGLHLRLAEKRTLAAINAFRKKIRLKPAAWNEAVAARARDHASRMARAKRRLHKFGNVGVREMLAQDGAGKWAPQSGPDRSWPNLTDSRPFGRHNLRKTADDPPNHVVVNVLRSTSLATLFEKYYMREPGFRLLAADPNLIEVGIGCARPKSRIRHEIYYCICWVQVNDKQVKNAQDAAYRILLDSADDDKPEVLRRIALWGRPKSATKLLLKQTASPAPERVGAAWDGLLALDETKTRKRIDKTISAARVALRRKLYGDAYRTFSGLLQITYDKELITQPGFLRREVELAAETELEQIRTLPDADQPKKLANLRSRCSGMPVLKEMQ